MEINQIEAEAKKAAKTIGIINVSTVVLMLLCCLSKDAAFFAFLLGLIAALVNFIMMIVYIVQKKAYAYIICIISMLLLPIIGFGCCAAGIGDMRI